MLVLKIATQKRCLLICVLAEEVKDIYDFYKLVAGVLTGGFLNLVAHW